MLVVRIMSSHGRSPLCCLIVQIEVADPPRTGIRVPSLRTSSYLFYGLPKLFIHRKDAQSRS